MSITPCIVVHGGAGEVAPELHGAVVDGCVAAAAEYTVSHANDSDSRHLFRLLDILATVYFYNFTRDVARFVGAEERWQQ